MVEPPTGYLVHAIDGRLRIRVPAKRRDAEYFTEAAHALGACAGVSAVEANVMTGSLLVIHDTTVEAIAEYGRSHDLFRMEHGHPRSRSARPPSHGFLDDLGRLNRRILGSTEGAADLGSLVAALFFVMALVQLARGQFAVPALSALWYALGALSLGKQLDAAQQPPDEDTNHGDRSEEAH